MNCPECKSADVGTHCELCGWTAQPERAFRPRPHDPDGISLDEFGQDLAEAIKTASALAWVTKMRKNETRMRLTGPDQTASALKEREAGLSKHLMSLIPRISSTDQRRIAEMIA